MFNWLKKVFKKSTDTVFAGLASMPDASGQVHPEAAPYKVEPPAAKPAPVVNEKKSSPVKQPRAPKKAPFKKPVAGTRGRKPKAKPAAK